MLKCIKCSLFLLMLFLAFNAWAHLLKGKVLFSENIQKANEIKFSIDPGEVKDLWYSRGDCIPLEGMDFGDGKNKKIRYLPTMSGKKIVVFTSSLYFTSKKEAKEFEMEVNGLKIKATQDVAIYFDMIENCTKLRPIGFVSTAKQKFLGVQLEKGSVLKPHFIREGEHWGQIGKDGYSGAWEGESFEELQKLSENFEAMIKRQETHLNICVEVKSPSGQHVYLYKNRILSPDVVNPQFWRGDSKYIGNVICSDKPNAVVDCIGTHIQATKLEDMLHIDNDKAVELGKKCDEAIAAHEKKTGQKIRESPYYPNDKL